MVGGYVRELFGNEVCTVHSFPKYPLLRLRVFLYKRVCWEGMYYQHLYCEFRKMLILPEPAPAANFPTIPCALLLNKHTLNSEDMVHQHQHQHQYQHITLPAPPPPRCPVRGQRKSYEKENFSPGVREAVKNMAQLRRYGGRACTMDTSMANLVKCSFSPSLPPRRISRPFPAPYY